MSYEVKTNSDILVAEVPRRSNDICDESNWPKEVKEIGLYEKCQDTLDVLRKTMELLEVFRHEISAKPDVGGFSFSEPTSFKDNIDQINNIAYAINGDLTRLVGEFR